MTFVDFIKKYNLEKWDGRLILMLFIVLDKLYLEYTPEQVQDIVQGYYEHADDIYNDIQEKLEESLDILEDLLGKGVDA